MKKFLFSFFLIICFKGFPQKILVNLRNGDFHSIDVTNCKSTLLGNAGLDFKDIAFTPDGRLWGVSEGKLYQIDTLTYTTKYIGDTGFSSVTSLVDLDDTTLIVDNVFKIYKVNVNTASTTYIGDIDHQYIATGDLTWYINDLYMSCAKFSNQHHYLIRMTLNASHTTIIHFEEINKKKLPIFYGLVTVSLTNESPILGFYSGDIYKICHEDGSHKQICSLPLPQGADGVWGAAAMKLPTPIKETGPCSYAEREFFIPNVFTPNNDGINDLWELGSFAGSATIEIFNRWGMKVKDVKINAEEIYKWDGGDCSSGVYYYSITTLDETYHGFFNLIR
jgi:gliding motility-associated-like protein